MNCLLLTLRPLCAEPAVPGHGKGAGRSRTRRLRTVDARSRSALTSWPVGGAAGHVQGVRAVQRTGGLGGGGTFVPGSRVWRCTLVQACLMQGAGGCKSCGQEWQACTAWC